MTLTDEVRAFNRFYTREIGLLNRNLPATDLSLPEARVLYELAQAPEGGRTAAEIGRALEHGQGASEPHRGPLPHARTGGEPVRPDHRKHRLLTLTDAGRKSLRRSRGRRPSPSRRPARAGRRRGRNRLIEAMRDIRMALRDREAATEVSLRPLRPGDVGWIIHRQAVLYTQEYGWDWTYEGLASRILGAFVAEFDPAREDGWVAERGGAIVGSIFLMKSDDPGIAKLRLLYVEPSARGAGVGRRLVATCIARARELGYRQLTLWTNDILVAARRIYQAAGFRLVSEEPHHSFGHDLVGQTWTLDLG